MNVWPKPSELTPEQIQHLIVYGENPFAVQAIKQLQVKVKKLTSALEYVAGPMMLGDDPTLGYHSQTIAYIEAALKEGESG